MIVVKPVKYVSDAQYSAFLRAMAVTQRMLKLYHCFP